MTPGPSHLGKMPWHACNVCSLVSWTTTILAREFEIILCQIFSRTTVHPFCLGTQPTQQWLVVYIMVSYKALFLGILQDLMFSAKFLSAAVYYCYCSLHC